MKKLLDSPTRTAAAKPVQSKGTRKTEVKGLLQAVFPSGVGAISLKDMTTRYGISYDTLTRMTGFSLRAVSNWSQGSKPSSSTGRRLTEIKRLFAALEKLVSPQAIGPGLRTPTTPLTAPPPPGHRARRD